ncbi:MAG TPA: DnaJ domain-containing protein, partial [Blastocatellia bacterium]|nr:DnaJ domain-containing protein [Blastocatellia bacterium]
MTGNLGDKLAADLIRDIANKNTSGLLRLTRGKAIKAIFFESGRPVFAISNQASEQLDHVLLQKQLVTIGQLEEAKQRAGKIARLGHALVEMGVVSQQLLHDTTTEIAQGIIFSVFEWMQGEYTFDERVRAVHEVKLDWSAADCILEGARHAAANEQFARTIAPDNATISQSSAINKTASTGRLSSAESYTLSMVSAPTQVKDVASMTGLPEQDIRAAVCALLSLGLLRKGAGPEEPEPVEQSEADDNIAQLQAEIARKIHFFSQADYYEILGVTRRSSPAEIKSAYYGLAKKFHPDRFRQAEYADLRLKLEALFAKMTQAYETLSDRVQKAMYDDKLKKSPHQPEPIIERPRVESLSSRPAESKRPQP